MERISKCKSCKADMRWVKIQATGKYMPCNPLPVPFRQDIHGTNTAITPDGFTVRCRLDGDPAKMTDVGYIPHWATCPYAGKYRRSGRNET